MRLIVIEDDTVVNNHILSSLDDVYKYYNKDISFAKGSNNGKYVTLIKQDNQLIGVIHYDEPSGSLQ